MIQLKTESVLQIPLQKYEKNFTFIVNSEKYETSSFIADLLSPIISSRHLIDSTFNEFTINTKHTGDFNKILSLISFNSLEIEDKDFPFIIETIEQLLPTHIEIKYKEEENDINNIFAHIEKHQNSTFYQKSLEKDIDFFSSHFYELKEQILTKIKNDEFCINNEIFEQILNNDKLLLDTEDDLIEVINELYLRSFKYSRFYEFVDFNNIGTDCMKKFIELFDIEYLTRSTWLSICDRLDTETKTNEKISKHKCRKKNEHQTLYTNFIEFQSKSNEFDGILNNLQTHSNIKEELSITASSIFSGDVFYLLQYDNINSFFETKDSPNSYICFRFKKHKIILSSYIIRSLTNQNDHHLRSWVLEGSNDNNEWTKIDEQQNNNSLNGKSYVHSFPISDNNDQKAFQYIRIRQTGTTWFDYPNNTHYYLKLNAIEFYGKMI